MFEIAKIHSVSVSSLNAKFRWRNAFVIIAQHFHLLLFIRSHVHDKSFFLGNRTNWWIQTLLAMFQLNCILQQQKCHVSIIHYIQPKIWSRKCVRFLSNNATSGSFRDTQKSLDYITIKDKMSGQHAINFHLMTKTWSDIILNHPRCGCFCSILLVISWFWSYSDSTFFCWGRILNT